MVDHILLTLVGISRVDLTGMMNRPKDRTQRFRSLPERVVRQDMNSVTCIDEGPTHRELRRDVSCTIPGDEKNCSRQVTLLSSVRRTPEFEKDTNEGRESATRPIFAI